MTFSSYNNMTFSSYNNMTFSSYNNMTYNLLLLFSFYDTKQNDTNLLNSRYITNYRKIITNNNKA
jgi:hypothetical protein